MEEIEEEVIKKQVAFQIQAMNMSSRRKNCRHILTSHFFLYKKIRYSAASVLQLQKKHSFDIPLKKMAGIYTALFLKQGAWMHL